MRASVDSIITRYGQSAALERRGSGERIPVKAFLQPTLKKQLHPPVAATPLGAVSEQRLTYIGRAGIDIAPGDKVQQGERVWDVQEAREIYCGDTLLYRWALLRPAKEAAV